MNTHQDPTECIRNAAVNPSCATSQQQQIEIENLKKKGLCIRCGIEKTHVVKKKGFTIRGGGIQMKPLSDEPCYKEYLCPRCFRIKISGGGSSTSLRLSFDSSGRNRTTAIQQPQQQQQGNQPSPSSSSSIPGRVVGDGDTRRSWTDDSTIGTNYTTGGGTDPDAPSYFSHTSQESRYTFGGGYYNNNLGSPRTIRPTTENQQVSNRNSHCARISVLPESVWSGRTDENTIQESRESMIFPKYESTQASRATKVTVLDSFDTQSSNIEIMYVVSIKDGRPRIAYRKLSYPPPKKIQHGQCIYCLRLEHGCGGFREPPLRDKWSRTVMIKEIEKQSYYGYDGKNDSPFKDAVVLQQIGDRNDGILSCDEILEDGRYLYVICPMMTSSSSTTTTKQQQQYYPKPLADLGVRHPRIRNPQTHNQIQEEHYIKYIFKQLVKSVKEAHMHGLCHRNLDPQKIYALQQPQQSSPSSSSRSTTIALSDFTTSVMVTTHNFEKRYLFVPGISGGSNRRYMAPEVYHYRVYDGIAADIWSLGVILFELLTGCRLHSHPTRMDPIYCFFVLHSGFLQASQGTIPDEIFERMMSSDSSFVNNNSDHSCGSHQMQDLMDCINAINQLSQEARNLLTDLLQESPPNRLSIQEVLSHPWFFRTVQR